MSLLLLAALAFAGEDGEEAEESVTDEVTIYGQLLVERARTAVITDLRFAGYTEIVDKGDHVVMRHESPWKGEVHLYDDGWMRIKRQKVRFKHPEVPYAEEGSALAWAHCIVFPVCIRAGGQTVSTRKFSQQKTRAVQRTERNLTDFSEKVADLATERKVNALPELFTALWEEGRPLNGEGPLLASPEERKQALLAFWESRTDTAWGEEVRAAIESFIRAEVQHSAHPLSDEEIAAFNAKNTAGRPFELRPGQTQ